jgi:alkyl hydroperoxide reductase subunit F
MQDCLIIGGGPAGLAAAVYLARQKITFTIVAKDVGGMALWSSDVENYLGFHLVSGLDLVKQFRKHLEDYKDAFTLQEGDLVKSVEQVPGGFRVVTEKGVTLEARTLLIATGEVPRKLNVPGEKEFYGKGVTYCATCDAPLFGGKDVIVVGGGNSAMDAALFLEKYAAHVTIITVNEALAGEAELKRRCETSEKMTVLTNTTVTAIQGSQFVEGIEMVGKDGQPDALPAQGVFIEIGLVPSSQFISMVKKNKNGEIIIDLENKTSIPGIWAAGDVTTVPSKQVAVAVGEGSKAALQIIAWLTKHPFLHPRHAP